MTKYTKKQRAGIAEAFKAAKPFLQGPGADIDNKSCWISQAIFEGGGGGDWQEGTAAAQFVIRSRLAGNEFLWQWLRERGIPKEDLTFDRLQAHRHAWLDLLIAEFSE